MLAVRVRYMMLKINKGMDENESIKTSVARGALEPGLFSYGFMSAESSEDSSVSGPAICRKPMDLKKFPGKSPPGPNMEPVMEGTAWNR